ncbi:hypothetical protein GOZ89_12385 [Agrobacterium vitis]|uniref:hypothetical protein n=1 Tax=Agrobacterium vitis TaxID=373 RepID=UPI0012E94310|nr:hypothetical protein [Agrobacterium vitis]MVA80217.1 hypothetical protein [Agrobacterium vitis]
MRLQGNGQGGKLQADGIRRWTVKGPLEDFGRFAMAHPVRTYLYKDMDQTSGQYFD